MGSDGKLVESEPEKYVTKGMVECILNGKPLSNDYQTTSRTFFIWLACLPSKNGLIPKENLTVSGDCTAVAVHANPFVHKPKHPENLAGSFTAYGIFLILMPNGETATKKLVLWAHALYALLPEPYLENRTSHSDKLHWR